MAVTQKLTDGLLQLGFCGEKLEDLSQKMDKYIGEIILFNSAYNLTNTSVYDEIVVNHILDSLSAVSAITELLPAGSSGAEGVKIGDIGSGGGLPGIPLAAALPEYNFVLVERMDKRCAFLENCAAILGLKNVSVLKKEAEKVPPESFDLATFRAFRPLDEKMTRTLLNLTKKGGFLAAYKAKLSSIQTEMDGIKKIVETYSVKKLTVPFLTENSQEQNRERNLVVIQKN
ncbi:MAG: 16S rRNA (guanine(527)-N(7))-methyltransferase RsmG [Treponema sp.]|nr:16S rRNA (guanine(527)-N(7))-methyltransferase RsmG [Treponema sp.]